MKAKIKSDQLIHVGFDVGLLLKALNALAEIIGGFALFFLQPDRINTFITFVTRGEISEDPNDLIMNHLIHLGQSFGISSWHFVIFYLLSHGIIKLTVLFLLWKKKLWAYPLSVAVFTGFIIYQLHRFTSGNSIFMLLLTLLDIIMIVLTILEYKRIKKEQKA